MEHKSEMRSDEDPAWGQERAWQDLAKTYEAGIKKAIDLWKKGDIHPAFAELQKVALQYTQEPSQPVAKSLKGTVLHYDDSPDFVTAISSAIEASEHGSASDAIQDMPGWVHAARRVLIPINALVASDGLRFEHCGCMGILVNVARLPKNTSLDLFFDHHEEVYYFRVEVLLGDFDDDTQEHLVADLWADGLRPLEKPAHKTQIYGQEAVRRMMKIA